MNQIVKTSVCAAFLLLPRAGNPIKPVAQSRQDSAERLTFSEDGISRRNPAFSPDGMKILFTRFLNGCNRGPSELAVLEPSTAGWRIVVPAWEADMDGPAHEFP
jgi:hypothetical protein